jgi:Family of unknown function (DUF6530)
MSYSVFAKGVKIDPSIELPDNLEHKPVYAMPYEIFDNPKGSDAKYISVGFAQWENEEYALSLKFMRHTGEKWSRQSEEFPLNRVIDAAIFLSKVLFDEAGNTIEIEKDTFPNQPSAFSVEKEDLSAELNRNYKASKEMLIPVLRERINALYLALDRYKKKGLF